MLKGIAKYASINPAIIIDTLLNISLADNKSVILTNSKKDLDSTSMLVNSGMSFAKIISWVEYSVELKLPSGLKSYDIPLSKLIRLESILFDVTPEDISIRVPDFDSDLMNILANSLFSLLSVSYTHLTLPTKRIV